MSSGVVSSIGNVVFGGIEFPSASSLFINVPSLLAVARMASSSFSIPLIFRLNSPLVRESGLKASSMLEKNTFIVWQNVRRYFGLQHRFIIFRHHCSAALQKIHMMKITSIILTAKAPQSNIETNDVWLFVILAISRS